jgi:hypothetical protein
MSHHNHAPDVKTLNDKILLEQLVALPQRILKHHEVDDLAQIVLHSLSHPQGFGLKRATYLMDNPDFDHLKGVASFTDDECKHHKEDIWQAPESFKDDMIEAPYHHSIKKFLDVSLRKKDIDLHSSQDIKELGKILGMDDPLFFSWHMRHGNHGLLIFEQGKALDLWQTHLLNNFAALLSMCAH